MTDQEKQDHWGNLAENVGATPPPDSYTDDKSGDELAANENENVPPEDTDQSPVGWGMTDSEANADVVDAEQTPGETIETFEIESRKVHAYRPKSGWDELASEFDLPQPEEPPEEPPEVREVAIDAILVETETEATAVDENKDVVDDSQEATPTEDVSAVDEVADDSEEEQESSDESPWFGAEDFDALFDDSPSSESVEDTAEESKGPSFEEAIETAAKEIDEEKYTGKRRKRRRRRPRKTEAEEGTSKEDATPEESLDTEVVSIADTGGFGAGLFGDAAGPDDASDVFTTEEEIPDASDVLQISPTISDEDESSQEETKDRGKKRGRRRRRRGSGKKKESTAGDEPTSQDSDDEEVSEKSSRRGPRKNRSDADREDSGGGRRGREPKSEDEDEKRAVSHRGIPSWDEAIESIIAANMERHSKKSNGGSSSRSRGGRGRGGKEKSGSRKRSN